jgi:ribosomal protein S18 acetylase RimI-like enzyme
MNVRPVRPDDKDALVPLIAQFRVALAQLREKNPAIDLGAAGAELADYLRQDFPIFVAEDHSGKLMGYLVCRTAGAVVWAESLFVSPDARRRGIGNALYRQAEALAERLGGGTVYNWVHPNNDGIISFLQARGYNVLNLIEIRRPSPGEQPSQRINVGTHIFDR